MFTPVIIIKKLDQALSLLVLIAVVLIAATICNALLQWNERRQPRTSTANYNATITLGPAKHPALPVAEELPE